MNKSFYTSTRVVHAINLVYDVRVNHKVRKDHSQGRDEIEGVYLDLGVRLATMRRTSGLTQREVAARAGMGRPTLANIEKGRQRVLYHQLLDIAHALGTDPRELLPPPGSDSPALGDLDELQTTS